MCQGAAVDRIIVVVRWLRDAVFKWGVVLWDKLGDGLRGDPWPRPIHFALAAFLDRVALHASFMVMLLLHKRRWLILVVLVWQILYYAHKHVFVYSLPPLPRLICLRWTLALVGIYYLDRRDCLLLDLGCGLLSTWNWLSRVAAFGRFYFEDLLIDECTFFEVLAADEGTGLVIDATAPSLLHMRVALLYHLRSR